MIVGVNAFTEGNDEPQPETLYIDHEIEVMQRKRLAAVKADRDDAAVVATLERLRRDAADPEVNLMPPLIEASRAHATLGEMMATMGEEFGLWNETARI